MVGQICGIASPGVCRYLLDYFSASLQKKMYASLRVWLVLATESQKLLQSDAQFTLLLHTTSFFESCLYKLVNRVGKSFRY